MKGQISLFIILGLALLLITGLLIYALDISDMRQNQLKKQYAIKDSLDPVKAYISSCIAQEGAKPIEDIGLNGGTLQPIFYTYFMGEEYNFLSYREPGTNVNSMLTRQEMESEIAKETAKRLENCIDLEIFRMQGFVIDEGEMSVKATITKSRVRFSLTYPLTFRKDEQSMKVSEFDAEIASPLGEVYEVAMLIVNNELATAPLIPKGHFDQMDFLTKHPDYTIEKHRPYPHTIYMIGKEGFTFRFAIEGEQTVMQPGYVIYPTDYGCCINYADRQCFKNTPASLCEKKGGTHTAKCDCKPSIDEEECAGCKSCKTYDRSANAFTGPVKQHGESWCAYDAIVGDGFDYVGTRHYMHYCLDGIEYVEECRDFREEICVEEGKDYTAAECRPNRWQSCYSCTTEECCDADVRDCIWKDWAGGNCVPQVPPGLKFWENSGAEICASGNELKECEGWTCPASWVDGAAMNCYAQGDCGASRNINDRITYGGYFNTDFGYLPDQKIYHKDGEKGEDYVLRLGDSRKEPALETNRLLEAQNSFAMMVASGYSYLNEISSLSITDFLNPFKPRPKIKVLDASICGLWVPASGSGDCHTCGDKQRPCTEYWCKSLGQACLFEMKNGTPSCKPAPRDTIPPTVKLTPEFLAAPYKAEDTVLKVASKTYKGYEISPDLRPHKPFTIALETSEETICRFSYAPRLEFIRLPSAGFGDSKFSTTHSILVRVPPTPAIPKKMTDAFNVTNLGELARILEEPEKMLGDYKSRYSGPLAAYRFITGKDLTKVIDPVVDRLLKVIGKIAKQIPFYSELAEKILEKFDSGGMYLFVTCTDRSGNVNAEEMFIEIAIDRMINDTEPPQILGFRPENGSLFANRLDKKQIEVYTDELASCRYSSADADYDDMTGQMACPRGIYEMSPFFGGSYVCQATLGLSDVTKAYVRCRDNPSAVKEYSLRIERASESSIDSPSKYRNITLPNIINISANMIDETPIRINASEALLQINMEELLNCTYSYRDIVQSFDSCLPQNDLDAGLYACTGKVLLGEDRELELLYSADIPVQPGVTTAEQIAVINFTEAQAQVFLNNTQYNVLVEGDFSCLQENSTETEMLSCATENNLSNCTTIFKGEYQKLRCSSRGNALVNISCQNYNQSSRNTNSASSVYVITRSPELSITGHGPKDESGTETELWAATNVPADCEYTKDLLLSKTPMAENGLNHSVFITAAKGPVNYYAVCNDEHGNTATQEISWQVVG